MSAPTKSTGLKGVVAGRTSLSTIDGEEGILRYCGYDIHDLAEHSTFEETAYLLWNGELPDRAELADFTTALTRERDVDDYVLDIVRRAPRDAPPMATLRTATSALGLTDPEAEEMSAEANRRKAIRITSRLATLTAAIDRCRNGEDPVAPDTALDHASNFLYMLKGERPSDVEARTMDVTLVLHADHGFNASTFASRVTAATLSDMHSAITSAIGTLKGPLHGGANQKVAEMLDEIGDPERVVDWVDAKLEAKERIMGFGHRVYKVEDPRARHLRKMAEKLSEEGDPRMLEIQKRLVDYVGEKKGLAINVDFYSGSAYSYLGIRKDLFPLIFALSRISGWTAHVLEQYADNSLIRPRGEYVGQSARSYVPVEER